MVMNLQMSFNSKLRLAVNGVNERGNSALDVALLGLNNETAEVFIQMFGKYMDLQCQLGSANSPRSEIRVIVPGNQQSHEKADNYETNQRARLHPIVSTMASGRFQLSSKLMDVAVDYYFKRKAEAHWKQKQDAILQEPNNAS